MYTQANIAKANTYVFLTEEALKWFCFDHGTTHNAGMYFLESIHKDEGAREANLCKLPKEFKEEKTVL